MQRTRLGQFLEFHIQVTWPALAFRHGEYADPDR